jgi:quercetin dioxygenase-like cupin family protein
MLSGLPLRPTDGYHRGKSADPEPAMRLPATMLSILLCTLALATSPGGKDFVRLTPEQLHWRDIPGSHGAQSVTIAGDPDGRHGLYIQRVRFPPHVMDRPHWHPNDRYATVLKGTWYTGTGPNFDPSRAVALKPGSVMLHPGKAVHWDGSNSNEEVIVQIVGLAPGDTTAVDPSKPLWEQLAP